MKTLLVSALCVTTTFGRVHASPVEDLLAQNSPSGVGVAHGASIPAAHLQRAHYKVDPVALARSREIPPFQFQGSGTSGKVVDRKGHVLLESGKDIGIYGIAVGPDKQHVLVKGGDAVAYVINPATHGKWKLPVKPPGENMLGFAWHWIGNTALLGVSEVEDVTTKPSEEPKISRTKLYVYDLTGNSLIEVDLPDELRGLAFSLLEVSSNGYARLGLAGGNELGWFKIVSPK